MTSYVGAFTAGAGFRVDTRTIDFGKFATDGTPVLRTPTLYRIETAAGTYTDFIGNFFRYTSVGDIIDGNVTQIVHISSGQTGFIAQGHATFSSLVGGGKGAGSFVGDASVGKIAPAIYKGSDKKDVLIASGLGGSFIDGKGGADFMKAYGGGNRFIVDASADRVIVSKAGPGAGFDKPNLIYAKVSYAMRAESGLSDIKAFSVTSTKAINLSGNNLDNTVTGSNGSNYLQGNDGDDKLIGLGGNDVLIGGNGNDILVGGTGRDAFVFDSALGRDPFDTPANPFAPQNIDTISDFTVGEDTIHLANSIFSTLTVKGALAPSAFVAGTEATKADQHIVYDPATGRLSYDADGSGAQKAVVFAILSARLPLSSSDFLVI
ncbi:calcium-binding protein [Microvirga alba]|uniref:Calcium-binding protein n=1 Tax=Microvirga alba TaxID=2791025 RepID=A0A931FNV3_9HYPH|nr:hypothetical protein [Microvirga alba]MBF9234065.1 hypothetical protein [Microvirga alba]